MYQALMSMSSLPAVPKHHNIYYHTQHFYQMRSRTHERFSQASQERIASMPRRIGLAHMLCRRHNSSPPRYNQVQRMMRRMLHKETHSQQDIWQEQNTRLNIFCKYPFYQPFQVLLEFLRVLVFHDLSHTIRICKFLIGNSKLDIAVLMRALP